VDFELFLMDRAKGVDVEAVIKKEFDRAFKERTTANLQLPPAPKDDIRYHIPIHILEHEIFTIERNGNKRVLYPAGFVFNPLDYTALTEEYYIINANRKAEVEWLKKQELTFAMVLISEGNAIDFSEILERPVYILDEFMRQGLQVRHTPSKVIQEGNRLVIYEYLLEGKQ
jgi:conjugal transfer pilus assembly protein TraW